jgi:NAD(P)-dependent dehydrogenase (short-subunit alcohol dehydrogenase family)
MGAEREGAMAGLCEGRVAVVTGAGRGIGREHVLSLARAGAKVVVNDLGARTDGGAEDAAGAGPAAEVADEVRAMGGEAVVNGDDVSDWDGARRLVETALDAFGRLDVLVNNAGILRDRMLVSMSESDWDAVVRVHLKGTFAPTHHAAAHWREQQKAGQPVDARVINTTSPSGIYGNVGQANYGAAKAGIAAFTVIAAQELGRYGVTVNAVAPSAHTRMTEDLPGWGEKTAEKLAPHWIAPIVTWLASAEAAGVTGQVFQVWGDKLGVAEGWVLGPSTRQPDDPAAFGPVVADLVARARPGSDMFGRPRT